MSHTLPHSKDMPYTAKITRGLNRTYFSIDFRHPVKRDRAGRFGLKVRRGLGTDDGEVAQRYLAEMNSLLADESLHRPTARAEAASRFSSVVVEAFYRDLEPIPVSRARERDQYVQLPGAKEGYATVLVVGTTASGKSTLGRQFLGTNPETERFPSTAPGRTTVADQEFILRPSGDYETVVSFLQQDLVVAIVEDALASAAVAHLQGRGLYEVARLMLSPREGRFRLAQILGSARQLAGPAHASTTIADDGDDEEVQTDTRRPSRVAEFARRLSDIADQVASSVVQGNSRLGPELFDSADRDSVEQDIDSGLRDSDNFTELVNDVVDEIALRFEDVTVGVFNGGTGGWPATWVLRSPDSQRTEFLTALRTFTSINAAHHGALLTPLVEGARIAGPFKPIWWTNPEPLRLVLIDGEGIGHNPETLRSLPGALTDRMAAVDKILLVDSALQPMLEGPTLVARALERLGQSAKLHICFTHVDEMRGAENLPTVVDKAAHVRDAARDVFHHLAREFARAHLPELDRALSERTFFVAGIHQVLPERSRFTRAQLVGLAESLRSTEPIVSDAAEPEYDLDNLVIAIAAAATDYTETYRALLRLPSQKSLSPVAWQTAKAATRYASQFGLDGYGAFRPAADFSMMLGERLARFLASPVSFHPTNCTEEAKERATASVRQALAKLLDPWIRERILAGQLPFWVRAYEHRGTGSTRLRALDIDVLNLAAVPPSSEAGDASSSQFRAEVKKLVVDAIREGSGRVRAISTFAA